MFARIVCGVKAIWAMPIYTDHNAKRGFPIHTVRGVQKNATKLAENSGMGCLDECGNLQKMLYNRYLLLGYIWKILVRKLWCFPHVAYSSLFRNKRRKKETQSANDSDADLNACVLDVVGSIAVAGHARGQAVIRLRLWSRFPWWCLLGKGGRVFRSTKTKLYIGVITPARMSQVPKYLWNDLSS